MTAILSQPIACMYAWLFLRNWPSVDPCSCINTEYASGVNPHSLCTCSHFHFFFFFFFFSFLGLRLLASDRCGRFGPSAGGGASLGPSAWCVWPAATCTSSSGPTRPQSLSFSLSLSHSLSCFCPSALVAPQAEKSRRIQWLLSGSTMFCSPTTPHRDKRRPLLFFFLFFFSASTHVANVSS